MLLHYLFTMIGLLILTVTLFSAVESVFLFPDVVKNFLLKLLRQLTKKLAVLDNWLDKKNVTNPLFFDDLSPIDNADQTEVYENALSWALKNEKIKNIAITGPYGSGKSSLIKTFEKKYPGYCYLNISLASFQEEQLIDGIPQKLTGTELQEQHRLVELSILQQMFYRVKTSRVRDSRFNRIRHLSALRIFGMSVITILGLIAFLILIKPSFLNHFSWFGTLNKQYADNILYAAILMALPLLYLVFANVLRLLNTSKFNKINLSDGEIEFNPKSETSVLNKHLDEILYFFEVTDYNVVVFEDLDRFNDPEIFTKLREISILVNKSLQIGRHIAFVYAIKDEMFRDKSRTKFFDLLIPVIPVITATNSYERFKAKFNQEGLTLGVTDKFISAITLYVDDMRTLKNIFNEFMVYAENLKNIAPNPDKLLALIVFKNAYPHEFAQMHEENGIVVKTFEAKPTLILNTLQEKDRKIAYNNKRIEHLREKERWDTTELRAVYLMHVHNLIDKPHSIIIDNHNRTLKEIYENEDQFEWLKSQSTLSYLGYHPSYTLPIQNSINFSFSELEKTVYPAMSYDDRRKIISGDALSDVNELLQANSKLNDEKRVLETSSLQTLIAAQNDQLTGLPEDLAKNKLLVYLIRNGYIDEAYRSLMSHFYEGSLSNRDMKFILSIRDKNPQPFEYELDMLDNLMERLEIEDFRQDSIFNLQLAIYVTAHRNRFAEKYEVFVGKLKDGGTLCLTFIEQLRQSASAGSFFAALFDHWTDFGKFTFDHEDLSEEQKLSYLKLILTHGSATQWKELDASKSLSNFTIATPGILQAFSTDTLQDRFKMFAKDRDVKFYELKTPADVPALFDFVIEEDRYELNAGMIRELLNYKGAPESQSAELQDRANYTAIQLSSFQPLLDVVDNRLSQYVNDLILNRPDNTKEDEAQIITLLNRDHLSEDVKNRIIEHQAAKISNLIEVAQTLWDHILGEQKMLESWANVLSYFNAFGLTSNLITYLNHQEVAKTLGKIRTTEDKSLSEVDIEKLWPQLLKCNELDEAAYKDLLGGCPWYYNDLSIEGLSMTKIKNLITKRKIRLNSAIFARINASTPELRGLLIEKNISDYLATPATYSLEAPDLSYLLTSTLDKASKDALLPLITDTQLEADKSLATAFSQQALTVPQKTTFTPETILIIFENASAAVKSKILQRFGHQLDTEKLKNTILQIDYLAPLLSANGKERTLPANAANTDILKLMKKAGLIEDHQRKKDDLIIKTKLIPHDQA